MATSTTRWSTQLDLACAVRKQEEQLGEDLGDVSPIEFDDITSTEAGLLGMGAGLLGGSRSSLLSTSRKPAPPSPRL